jgi:hypothetical protein
MKLITHALISLALIVLATSVQARPDVRTMTCSQAKSFVKKSGAVVMTTGKYTYERFVANGSSCRRNEGPSFAFTATKDKKNCRIGFVCKDIPFDA